MRGVILFLVCVLSSALACTSGEKGVIPGTNFDVVWEFAPLPPPQHYGNILISRLTRSSTHPPVTFSHWIHRRRYTCRDCHFELNIAMKTNATDITESKIRKDEYCGACHNAVIAFAVSDQTCKTCHAGNIGASDGRFSELSGYPRAKYGDEVLFGWLRPKWFAIAVSYLLFMALAVLLAMGIRSYAVSRLPAVQTEDGLTLVPVFARPATEVRDLYRQVLATDEFHAFLAEHRGVNLAYLMPGDFFLTALVTDESRRFSDDIIQRFPRGAGMA